MPRTNLTIKLPSGEIVKMGACKQAKVKTQKIDWKQAKPKDIINRGEFYYRDIKGQLIDGKLRFRNCAVHLWNRLIFPNNAPIAAKSVAYYFTDIHWCPGRGWPVYSTRCPLSDSSPSMLFPNAKRHQLIVQFGNYYWPECANSNAGSGNQITEVFVGVNDDQFGDNTGSFDFWLTAYGV